MRVGLDRAEVVDADHFDVGALRFRDGAQHVAADAAESVDRNPDRHVRLLTFRRHGRACPGHPRLI
jgi:hypothetical protein